MYGKGGRHRCEAIVIEVCAISAALKHQSSLIGRRKFQCQPQLIERILTGASHHSLASISSLTCAAVRFMSPTQPEPFSEATRRRLHGDYCGWTSPIQRAAMLLPWGCSLADLAARSLPPASTSYNCSLARFAFYPFLFITEWSYGPYLRDLEPEHLD